MSTPDSDYTGRGWVYGDTPCGYEGCSMPVRTHVHYSAGPSDPWHVVYYDEQVPEWQRNLAPRATGSRRARGPDHRQHAASERCTATDKCIR